jgi:putative FmdB family regulatory protein
MPVYTYRREDGTTFEVKQKFTDDPYTIDPATGQQVKRVVQAAGVIFKGQGFYVNDSKSASKSSVNGGGKSAETKADKGESKSDAAAPVVAKDAAPAAQKPAPASAAS